MRESIIKSVFVFVRPPVDCFYYFDWLQPLGYCWLLFVTIPKLSLSNNVAFIFSWNCKSAKFLNNSWLIANIIHDPGWVTDRESKSCVWWYVAISCFPRCWQCWQPPSDPLLCDPLCMDIYWGYQHLKLIRMFVNTWFMLDAAQEYKHKLHFLGETCAWLFILWFQKNWRRYFTMNGQ